MKLSKTNVLFLNENYPEKREKKYLAYLHKKLKPAA